MCNKNEERKKKNNNLKMRVLFLFPVWANN